MSAQTIARWNAIPMERTEGESAKRPRSDEDDDDDISLVSRTPSPAPQADGMDVDHRYDEYVHGPPREVVTVETRIKPSNIGFAMLARMGWQEGQPVGLSGDGRVDPIPFTVKSDQTGLGKLSQDVEMIETTVAQRRDMESERWAKQSRQQKEQLQEDAARKAALHDSLADTLRPFYCALCDKQFKNVAQYDEHTNSYAHAHKVREKDMKASLRIGADADERKEKERKREERELRKLAKAQGVRMPKVQELAGPAGPPPVPVEPEVKVSGWNSVGPAALAPAPASGWAAVGSPTPAPVAATPAFRTAGWSSLDTSTTSGTLPAVSESASQSGFAPIAASGPTPAPRVSGGWASVSIPTSTTPSLPQAAAVPSPISRPDQPEPESTVAVTLASASASSPVPRPQRPAPEPEAKPKQDRENKRAGWQNFRAGKAGRR